MHKYSERTDWKRKPKRPRLEIKRRRRKDDEFFFDLPEPLLLRTPLHLI